MKPDKPEKEATQPSWINCECTWCGARAVYYGAPKEINDAALEFYVKVHAECDPARPILGQPSQKKGNG